MEEKDFIKIILSERMGMHYERFKKDYPPTAEQAAKAEKADQAHETLFGQLTQEQRELLEVYEDDLNLDAIRKNEYYYRAGFQDGVCLDRLMKRIRENNK